VIYTLVGVAIGLALAALFFFFAVL